MARGKRREAQADLAAQAQNKGTAAKEYDIAFTYMLGDHPVEIVIKPVIADNELEKFSMSIDVIGTEIFNKGKAALRMVYFEFNREVDPPVLVPKKLVLTNVVAYKAALPTFIPENVAVDREFQEKQEG